MRDLTVPVPVALAGAVLCVLGGYAIGAAAGPDPDDTATAEVRSYDAETQELCLTGPAVDALPESEDGELCGSWRHMAAAPAPREGDSFRFTTIVNDPVGEEPAAVFIYGESVR